MYTIQLKVKCNQTGKAFISPLHRLEDGDCNPILEHQLQQGASVYWTDDNEGYPVTSVKLVEAGVYMSTCV